MLRIIFQISVNSEVAGGCGRIHSLVIPSTRTFYARHQFPACIGVDRKNLIHVGLFEDLPEGLHNDSGFSRNSLVNMLERLIGHNLRIHDTRIHEFLNESNRILRLGVYRSIDHLTISDDEVVGQHRTICKEDRPEGH